MIFLAIILSGSDPDNDPLTFEIATSPNNGQLSGTSPDLLYTPNTNYHGQDSLSFIASDGTGDSLPATVTLTVNPVNDAPVANTGEGQLIPQGVTVQLDGSGSTDIDSASLKYQSGDKGSNLYP
jgi:hypothetical protein